MKYSNQDLAELQSAFETFYQHKLASSFPNIGSYLIRLHKQYADKSSVRFVWDVYWKMCTATSYRAPSQYNDAHIETAVKRIINSFTHPYKIK